MNELDILATWLENMMSNTDYDIQKNYENSPAWSDSAPNKDRERMESRYQAFSEVLLEVNKLRA